MNWVLSLSNGYFQEPQVWGYHVRDWNKLGPLFLLDLDELPYVFSDLGSN